MQSNPTQSVPKLKDLYKYINGANVDLALGSESICYDNFAKKPDTVANFSKVLQPIQLPMFNHGKRNNVTRLGYAADPRKIGFYLVSGSILAHTNVLATYTKNAKKFVPKVYVIGEKNERLQPHLNCEVEWLPLTPEAVKSTLPASCRRDSISALCGVSCPLFLSFYSGIRPTPKVVWWSYKYQSLKIPGLDAYISTNQAKEGWWDGPNGNKWYNTPGAFEKLFDPAKTPQALAIRAELGAPDKIILGVIGRTEKLNNEVYASTIGRILSGSDNTIFCYACREKPTAFGPLEAQFGNRIVYLGWVDTLVATQVFDVYLDSFPLGSGQVFCEAAAAGKPIVYMIDTPEARQSSIPSIANVNTEGPALSPKGYAERAKFYIDNPDFRALDGDLWKNWVLTNKMNKDTFVDSFERIMEEVIG